jgi:AbiV family abortive infection protein
LRANLRSKKTDSPPMERSEYSVLAQASFENAASWLEDAQTLIDRKSFGHSVALSRFALEETAKGIACWYVSEDIWPLNNSITSDAFWNHSAKNQTVVANLIAVEFNNFLFSTAKGEKTQISESVKKPILEWTKTRDSTSIDEWGKCMELERRDSIYVGYGPKIPNQTKQERAEQEYCFAKAVFSYFMQFVNLDEQGKQRLRARFKQMPKGLWKKECEHRLC